MLVVGLAERDGDRLHKTVVLIDCDGTLLLRHRKVNVLAELMDPPYTAGSGAAQSFADTRHGRIGLLICVDIFQEDLVAQLADARPDLVLIPYGWAAPAEAWPEHGKSLHSWIAHTAHSAHSAHSVHAPVLGVDATGSRSHGPSLCRSTDQDGAERTHLPFSISLERVRA